jgi:hypothetical protein
MPTLRPADRHDGHPVSPTTLARTSLRPRVTAAEIHRDGAPIAAGEPLHVGSFCFWFVGQRWEWSDEVCRMHGYQPGAVVPTTELVLSHKHPDDRSAVQDLLDQALYSGVSFSSRHRLLDTAGDEHSVIVVADRMVDKTGSVVGTQGYYIDVTAALDKNRKEVLEARAVIEQAKGALRVVYGINDEQAFSLLKWRSQQTNTKVRALAAQLVDELDTVASASKGLRSQFDHLFLTVHQRIPADHACS